MGHYSRITELKLCLLLNTSTFLYFHLAKSLYTPSCFTILDTVDNPIDLKLKEGLHINKNKPYLNKQVHYFNTFLAL